MRQDHRRMEAAIFAATLKIAPWWYKPTRP